GKPTPRTGTDRTSVVFTVPHEPGSLASILQEFAYRNLDMLRIESRPTRKKFGTYRFFVDLAGHIEDDPVAEALRAPWLRTDDVRFIASWAAAGETGPLLDTTEFDNASAWVARVRAGRSVGGYDWTNYLIAPRPNFFQCGRLFGYSSTRRRAH